LQLIKDQEKRKPGTNAKTNKQNKTQTVCGSVKPPSKNEKSLKSRLKGLRQGRAGKPHFY
jgi:hypothetical protein